MRESIADVFNGDMLMSRQKTFFSKVQVQMR